MKKFFLIVIFFFFCGCATTGHYHYQPGPIGPELPLAVIGGAMGYLANSTVGPWIGAAAGWLAGEAVRAQSAQAAYEQSVQAAQRPLEYVEWYSDSAGKRWYRIRGQQWRVVPPQTTPPFAGPFPAK